MYLEFFMISEETKKEVDLISKMIYTFVQQIKYICIKTPGIGNHLETDVL